MYCESRLAFVLSHGNGSVPLMSGGKIAYSSSVFVVVREVWGQKAETV